jgi:DNA replication ATP-dependent helicase Dna2
MIDPLKARELAEKLVQILSPEAGESALLIFQRKLLEQIYKELLTDVPMVFNGLFARMQYFHDNFETPPDLVRQLNVLRVMANKAAHEEIASIPPGAVNSGAKSIYELLRFLSPNLAHPQLDELVKDAPDFPRQQHSKKHSFHCLVKEWKYYYVAGQIAGLELSAINEDNEELSILLRDDTKNPRKAKISKLGPSLWQYANLNCLELSEVAGKENYYVDNPRSMIVLEPDFLIDASAVAECMTSESSTPELYVLNRLFGDLSSERMLLGKMVNSIFDDLIHLPDLEYLELFKRGLSGVSIPMVALGQECAMDIYKEIQSGHLDVVKAFCAEVPDEDLLLEPSFLCPAYGLQGRLDLLYKKNGKYSIVELKSGKAHPSDVWPTQMYQVVAYNMIIRNAYGAAQLGSSSIFYSSNKEKPLRNVANMPLLEQNLLQCRNRIVGIMHLLCEHPRRFFDWLAQQPPQQYSSFSGESLQRFKRLLTSIRAFEYEWFCEQVKRVVREIWSVKTGSADSEASFGHNALWRQSAIEKKGKIIGNLQIVGCDQREITLKYNGDPGISDFRSGDIVVLYQEYTRVDKQEIIRGVVSAMHKELLTLRLRGGLKRKLNHKASWVIEHDVLESFLYGPLSSLTTFLEADPALRDLYLGFKKPTTDSVESIEDEKESVLARMKAAKDLFIVQGPPGTGKTSGLIGNYVQRVYENSNKKLMVLSFTNRAVDEICLCLKQRGVPFIRTGNSQVIEDELLDKLISDKRYQDIDKLLRENRIFIATVQSANSWFRDMGRLTKIDEMIVDEASQIMESSILGLLTVTDKTLLIGDQNQLPAISVQKPLDYCFESQELQSLDYGSINQSLMERLFRLYTKKDWKEHLEMLTGHYRMHFKISSLIAHYYDNRLQPALKEQYLPLAPTGLPEQMDTRLLWIECPPSAQEFFDPLMVQTIVKIVGHYHHAGLVQDPQKNLGIVAPYRVMIHALKQEIDEISIDTVERYQGSERDAIILCFPLSHTLGLRNLQAISADGKVDRKLNVALSRARSRLIILGNRQICSASPHYAKLYENIRLNGRIIDVHEIIN